MDGARESSLLERAAESAVLEANLDAAARGDGRLVLVEGEAGIGKTQLLAHLVAAATERGVRVARATGGELEQDLPYGVMRQLLEPVVHGIGSAEREALFAGTARFAAQLFGLDGPVSTAAAGAESIPLGLYWVVVELSQLQPLVLAVDDLQWVDRASLQFLTYLARRLEDIPVLLVVAERTTEHPLAAAAMLEGAAARASVVRPQPLSQDAVATMTRERFSPDAAPEFVRACHESTDGNPFLVGELLRELAVGSWTGDATEAHAVADVGPRTIANAVLLRLARLPRGAARVARSLAVLGESAEIRYVAGLADMDTRAVSGTLGGLSRSRIIDDARPLRFVHPIVRRSIYEELTASERSYQHGRAARLLAADGAPDEAIAAHLLLAEPDGDPLTVARLRNVARRSLSRGDADTAHRYLERAGREPPTPDLRPVVDVERLVAALRAHHADAATELRAALARCSDVETRVRAARVLGAHAFLIGDAGLAVEVLVETLDWLEARITDHGGDEHLEELALLVEIDLANAVGFQPAEAAAMDHRLERLHRVAAVDEPGTHAERLALAGRAVMLLRSGDSGSRCVQLLKAAYGGGRLLNLEGAASARFVNATTPLIFSDEFEFAEKVLADGMVDARRHGSTLGFAHVMLTRSLLDFRRGRLSDAEADAAAVEDLGEGLPPQVQALLVAWLVHPTVHRGDLERAAAVLERYGMTGEVPDLYTAVFVLEARGWLRMEQGDPGRAARDFLECGARLDRLAMTNPAIIPWRSSAALGLAACGDVDRARSLASDSLRRAERFGSLRCTGLARRALAAAAAGQERLELLAAAVDDLGKVEAPLERARVLVDLGMTLRRERRRGDARGPLRLGLDLATRCGAEALADLAERELRAAGAKPRRRVLVGPTSLTPSERRIALMAAEGMTNRQIAQQLFVSLRTVENHLSGVFRKLGIQSRAEVAAVLEHQERELVAD